MQFLCFGDSCLSSGQLVVSVLLRPVPKLLPTIVRARAAPSIASYSSFSLCWIRTSLGQTLQLFISILHHICLIDSSHPRLARDMVLWPLSISSSNSWWIVLFLCAAVIPVFAVFSFFDECTCKCSKDKKIYQNKDCRNSSPLQSSLSSYHSTWCIDLDKSIINIHPDKARPMTSSSCLF